MPVCTVAERIQEVHYFQLAISYCQVSLSIVLWRASVPLLPGHSSWCAFQGNWMLPWPAVRANCVLFSTGLAVRRVILNCWGVMD